MFERRSLLLECRTPGSIPPPGRPPPLRSWPPGRGRGKITTVTLWRRHQGCFRMRLPRSPFTAAHVPHEVLEVGAAEGVRTFHETDASRPTALVAMPSPLCVVGSRQRLANRYKSALSVCCCDKKQHRGLLPTRSSAYHLCARNS